MKRAGFLFAALTVWLFNVSLTVAATKPNVVFILIDDYGWADVGVNGSKFYKTPNIDRIAAQGARFTDGYAACPVCSPTRASIMTGKYPARLQLTDWLPGRGDKPDQKLAVPKIQQQLPLAEVTLAEALKASGYVTAHIGKWHLGGEGFEPQKQGFDVNIGGDHTGTPLSYFAPFEAVDRRAGAKKRTMPGLEKSEPGEYLTDRLALEAEKFIDANKDKPFFLYLSHFGVHTPMRAKPELVTKYQSDGKVGTQTNAIYAAMIESMDDSVGRVLNKLEALKLAENTLVIFTSDNGGLCVVEGPNTPATINSPLREGKGYLYEGGIRTPWVMQWPSVIKAGAVFTNVVSSVDFFPTILEATGTAMPPGVKPDGASLVGLLKNGQAPKRDSIYWHYPHYSNQGGRPGGAIREGDWKLIEFYDDGRLELFDVRKDRSESRNLAGEQKTLAIRLQRKLDQWRRDTQAQMMDENTAYVPNPQAANGDIVLHAKYADIHGTMVRYEPLPHKNTLGFWVRAEDSVSWDFQVTKPGKFTLEALQGCGTGQGGSEVEFRVGEQKLKLTVEDTGHFQNFKPKELGSITIDKPGRYTLHVQPLTKAKAAVMDLRMVTLKMDK